MFEPLPEPLLPLQKPAASAAPRIVSLVPSVTELLCALGLAPLIVGRTGFCIHPAQGVAGIPKVGGTKDVNLVKIRNLGATHVVVNVDENELPTVQRLREIGLKVVVTHPQSPHDNLALIDQLATEFIATNDRFALATGLKDQISSALKALEPLAAAQAPTKVLYLIWREPWMTVARDTYISRMLGLIGWQTWPDVQGGERGAARYPVVDTAELADSGVQRILLSSEPYRFDASHRAEAQKLVPGAQVQLVDGEALSWYGSRCLEGFALLQRLAKGRAD